MIAIETGERYILIHIDKFPCVGECHTVRTAIIVNRLLKISDFDFTMFIPPATQNYIHKYTIIQ